MTEAQLAGTDLEQATPPRPRVWNVPNSFTIGRLVLAAIVFAMIEVEWYRSAFVVFSIAALTDALDGYLARRLGQVSALGRQLDPLVDKLIVAGSLIYLLPVPGSGVAAWVVTVIVVRELVVQALRSLVEGRGIAFGARMAGKLKTTVQCLAIGAVLIGLGWSVPDGFAWLRQGLLWLAAALTVYSGLVYVAAAWPLLQAESSPKR
jgi:CDP-diacylglycerol--glycerol-3-phosphate 3-phosphatidyltransferase